MNENEKKIIRTNTAGVFFGIVESRRGQEAVIRKSRRLWYWAGANALDQLAMEGTKNPLECKFTMEVDRRELTDVVEILDTTNESRSNLESVPVWKQ